MYQAAPNFSGLVDNIITQMKPIVSLLVGLALVYFLWGIAQFILNSGDEAKREDAKRTMAWGVIALFVMVSFWALANLIANSLGLGPTSP